MIATGRRAKQRRSGKRASHEQEALSNNAESSLLEAGTLATRAFAVGLSTRLPVYP